MRISGNSNSINSSVFNQLNRTWREKKKYLTCNRSHGKLIVGWWRREVSLQISTVLAESFRCALFDLDFLRFRLPFLVRRTIARYFLWTMRRSAGIHVRSNGAALTIIVFAAGSARSIIFTADTVFVTVLIAMALWIIVVLRIVSVECVATAAGRFL